jgi:hypothetical protein
MPMADTSGFPGYGFVLLNMGIYGHLPTGVMLEGFTVFTQGTGVLMLDFTEVLIMDTDTADQDFMAEDGKAVHSDIIPLWLM